MGPAETPNPGATPRDAQPTLGRPTSPHQGPVAPGVPEEPVLEVTEIQGNILAGFNKDYQALIYLKIHDPLVTKQWLRVFATCVATVDEVLAFNRLFRAMRKRRQDEPCGLAATWMNIAFSANGLKALTSEEVLQKFEAFAEPFTLGLAARSSSLGDPTSEGSPGHPSRWVVGGTADTTPDILVIVASDHPVLLKEQIDRLREEIGALPRPAGAAGTGAGLEIMDIQYGATLAGGLRGHEHFGFKDGISHPGIRGRVSAAEEDFLTPRYIDFTDAEHWLKYAQRHGKPGQPLVWPGEFVLGYARQSPNDFLKPADPLPLDPGWLRNGSFLVYRRLRQDVAAFWRLMHAEAERLAAKPGFTGITAVKLASLCVGRWPSGAPVMRSPERDNPDLATDDLGNNYFEFCEAVEQVPVLDASGDDNGRSHDYGPVPSAQDGVICPYGAHVRKVFPRDDPTDQGGPRNSLLRLILRRGIPFGPPLEEPMNPGNDPVRGDRGLLFLCYQASIERQFEFLTTDWANQADKAFQGGGKVGHDPLIGQAGGDDGSRKRSIFLRANTGTEIVEEEVELPQDLVIPTGGGYFFAPSISALTQVLAR